MPDEDESPTEEELLQSAKTCTERLSATVEKLANEEHEPSVVMLSLLQGAAMLATGYELVNREDWLIYAAQCFDDAVKVKSLHEGIN